jgi:hypothetical protein
MVRILQPQYTDRGRHRLCFRHPFATNRIRAGVSAYTASTTSVALFFRFRRLDRRPQQTRRNVVSLKKSLRRRRKTSVITTTHVLFSMPPPRGVDPMAMIIPTLCSTHLSGGNSLMPHFECGGDSSQVEMSNHTQQQSHISTPPLLTSLSFDTCSTSTTTSTISSVSSRSHSPRSDDANLFCRANEYVDAPLVRRAYPSEWHYHMFHMYGKVAIGWVRLNDNCVSNPIPASLKQMYLPVMGVARDMPLWEREQLQLQHSTDSLSRSTHGTMLSFMQNKRQ